MNKNTFLKGFLPFASATLLLSSCSEDKTVPGDNDGQAIVFRVQNALPSLRAAGTTVGYMDAFVINGLVDQVESGHKSGLTLFDRTTVSRVIGSGANVFTYSPTKYYPKGATKAEFSAFSPVSSRIAASDFQTNDNCITYSVPSPARGTLTGDVDVAPQEDLLVAHTRKDDLTGAVVLQFRHALSRVSVRAVNLIDQPVRIHSLSLHNLYTTGTLDIDGKSYDDGALPDDVSINEEYITPKDADGHRHANYKVLWETVGQTKKALAWQLAESGVMVPVGGSPVQVTADDQALLVLPQTTQNTGNDAKVYTGDFYLEVTYTVGKITETIQAAFNDINKLTPDNNQGLTFEMGRQYAINVSITATGLSFGLEVKNWDEPPATQFVIVYDDNMGRRIAQTVWTTEQNYKAAAGNLYNSPQGGYSFMDWSTNADATGYHYMPEETIENISADMTLYAQWGREPAEPVENTNLWNFPYNGTVQPFTAPEDGYYKLEAWGASGGYIQAGAYENRRNMGGYSSGNIYLNQGQMLYIYVGETGGQGYRSGTGNNYWKFNGGGPMGISSGGGSDNLMSAGGGATDIRLLLSGSWDDEIGLNSRIIVAGAGGAGNSYPAGSSAMHIPDMGDAGGLEGYAGGGFGAIKYDENTTGGTQTAGGAHAPISSNTLYISRFGKGGGGGNPSSFQYCAGGGGGYYGGGAGKASSLYVRGGGGGSSFISGMTNCVAIDPTDTTNDQRTQDAGTGFAKTALNFNTAVFGASPTWADGKEIAFTNTVMIDGKGFEWKDGVKASTAGTMPNPAGGTMTGNSGNGHARITMWEKLE